MASTHKAVRPTSAANEGSGITKILSLRVPIQIADWVTTEARKRNWSSNETYCKTIEAVMTWFGLPTTLVRALEADRRKMNLDLREYYAHVLVRRYETVREQGPGFENVEDGNQ